MSSLAGLNRYLLPSRVYYGPLGKTAYAAKMWCGCSSLPKEARKSDDAPEPVDAKSGHQSQKSPSHSVTTPRSPPSKAGEVVIPKHVEVETKKADADAALHNELKDALSGMWIADWHASESLEPILILQGLPFFKRKAILAQGIPSQVIEFNDDTVTVTSIRGSKMDKVTAEVVLDEKPKTPSSIVAICEEDDVKESVKASFTDLPKSLEGGIVGSCTLYNKCLKIDHRFLNGDRNVEYHAVQKLDKTEKLKKTKSKLKTKKFTTSHFCNRTLGKEARATVVSYREEVSGKSQTESKPEEDVAQAGAGERVENAKLSGPETGSGETPGVVARTGVASGTETLKNGIGVIGAATVGAVVATDQTVTPQVTAWLLPPLKKKEVAQIESQQKHKAPTQNVLKLSSSTTGLDDIASWLTPSMQAVRKADNQLETSSVYSQQSKVSESFLVNPFSVEGGGHRPARTARAKSARAAKKQETGMLMEARAMSLLFPFSGTDDSPRSVKENDAMYTFRDDDDEEFKKAQSHSFQLLEQFKGK